MKRLFKVVDRTTRKQIQEDLFFSNKMEAKALRDEHKNAMVVPGPDHRRYVK